MSTARSGRGLAQLKPQYNRVRTSNALKTNSLWTDAIGLEQEVGTNAAIEAAISAPGGNRDRESRRERAQQLVSAAGVQQKVTSYEGLMSLAKSQGLANNATRGACKICGGLGHLTKQCKNGVSGHSGTLDDLEMEAAAAARKSAALLPDSDDLSSLSSDLDSSSSSDSDSDSDREEKRKSKKRSRDKKSRKEKDKDRKRSKDKKRKKHKKDKSRKSKRARTEGSGSDSDR